MRLVFVNHCHPDTPHVCAARVRGFAEAAARAGHQVVLLTETLPDRPAAHSPATLPAALAAHDWHAPFRLACAPVPGRLVAALREGRVPRPLRRPLLAAAYLARGGLFTDWRDGSRPFWPVLAKSFRPDAVWGSFGNTDCWAIAQGIARAARCRWVMDVKDPWSVFIPGPLRTILARRFGDAAAMTVLSRQHGQDAARWFPQPPRLVYSGIDSGFLAPPAAWSGDNRLLLVGGLYADRNLAALMDGIGLWIEGGARDVIVTYVGGEGERFQKAAAPLAGRARLENAGWVGLERMRALAAASRALLYVRTPAALYQHKLLELVALERPVLCLPPESDEAMEIARTLGAAFHPCADAPAVAAALKLAAPPPCPIDRAGLAAYGWDAQARSLLEALA